MVRGRGSRRMARIRRQVRAAETTCYRCGQPIDWSLPHLDDQGRVVPQSGTLEHKLPLSRHPDLAEDPGNIAASHWLCNRRAADDDGRPPLGLRSRDW